MMRGSILDRSMFHALLGGLFLLVATGLAGPAAGSFECLPGPVPGGLSDWAGREAIDRGIGRRTWRATFSLGRPASVRELAWTHARVGRKTGPMRLCGEGFVLAMADLYREQVLGIWVASERLGLGLRHWRAVWEDRIARSGWTGSVIMAIDWHPIRFEIGLQDLRLGRTARAGPSMRLGGLASIQAEPRIDLLCGFHRYRGRWGGIGGIRWRCADLVTLQEEVAFPDGAPRTGLQFGAGSPRIGLWFEPSAALGWRLGVTCTFAR